MNTSFNNINFDLPKNNSNVIKVIGVGGGGSNAVNHMFTQGLIGVDFVVCNTDSQALQNSPVPNKIQLGVSLTEGLGAGANPDIGEKAALESIEEIKNLLSANAKMVFITAGMGGGTGTGAAPVIAQMARELDLLTIGIVTIPFNFEGKTRIDQALKGVETLRQYVDSLIIINNNKLRDVYGNLGFKAGFSKADEVLSTAARGIAQVITHHYTQNIDLRDAKTVLANSGTAIMGSATAAGKNRSQNCIIKALDSPLLNDNKITGARNVLLLIVSGTDEITIDEIGEINEYIQSEAKSNVNIIMGVGEDENLGDAIAVTIIATGFNKDQQSEIVSGETSKIIHILENEQESKHVLKPNVSIKPMYDLPIKKYSLEDVIEAEKKKDMVINDFQLIPTNEVIKNIDVIYELMDEEEIIITNNLVAEKEDEYTFTSTSAEIEEDDESTAVYPDEIQTSLVFEFPIEQPKQQKMEVEEPVKNIEILEYDEIKSTSENETEVIHYSLEDYMELENKLETSKIPELDDGFSLEIRTNPFINSATVENDFREVSPLNGTIMELSKTAKDRREKMKDFNYKFYPKQTQNIEELEKEPAYKRRGIEIDTQHYSADSHQTNTTISLDSNDEIKIRTNNSFLHDNVD
ncbi:MAG: cell division protein FtsZ [Flavobacteriaceae bacterium]|jgi:cell division protein FtsZ|nr:cell division protein FtsZ [Flavobacteriaceae bacterium]